MIENENFKSDSGSVCEMNDAIRGFKVRTNEGYNFRRSDFRSEVVHYLYQGGFYQTGQLAFRRSGDNSNKGGRFSIHPHCNGANTEAQCYEQGQWYSLGYAAIGQRQITQDRYRSYLDILNDVSLVCELEDIVIPRLTLEELANCLEIFERINSCSDPVNKMSDSCLKLLPKDAQHEKLAGYSRLGCFQHELFERYIRWSPIITLSGECALLGYEAMSRQKEYARDLYMTQLRYINRWLDNCPLISWSEIKVGFPKIQQFLRGQATKDLLIVSYPQEKLHIDPKMTELLGYLVWPFWVADDLRDAVVAVNSGNRNHRWFREQVFSIGKDLERFASAQ